jgi:hypothetical protein
MKTVWWPGKQVRSNIENMLNFRTRASQQSLGGFMESRGRVK